MVAFLSNTNRFIYTFMKLDPSAKRHKVIKSVKTRIRKKRQFVVVELMEVNDCIFLSPEEIRQNTGIEPFELELLVGSKIRVEFFKIGEEMLPGKINESDTKIVKDFFIELSQPIEKLRNNFKDKLIPFSVIKSLRIRESSGRRLVVIESNNSKDYWINLEFFLKRITLEESELHILEGSYIFCVYHEAGEDIGNGKTALKSGTILKDFILRFKSKYKAMHEDYENNLPDYYDENMYPMPHPRERYTDRDFIRDVLDGSTDAYWGTFD